MNLDHSFRNILASSILGVLYEYRKLPLDLALLRLYLDPKNPIHLRIGDREVALLKYDAQVNRFLCAVPGDNHYAGEHALNDPISFDILWASTCEQNFGSFQEGKDIFKDKKFKLYIKDLLFYEKNQQALLVFCYLKCFSKSIVKLGIGPFHSVYLASRKVNSYHIKYGSAGRWQLLSLKDRLEFINDEYPSGSVEVLLDV